MMAGALTSAGGSIWSQKSANGSVDWGTVLRDGAVGAATGLIGGGASAAAAKATAGMANCLGKNIVTGAVEGAIDGGASNGLQYLTSGESITPAGFARAVGEGAGEGAIGGGAGGALSKVTGVSRYGCFTPDTPVVMADGSTKRIDQVEVGERVLAHDPATGEDVAATVEQTFTHDNVPTLRVTTTGGVVETTATHPFYVEGRGYTPASELHEGDVLHTPDGQVTQVVSVQATGRAETVHNLAIGGLHNYHVVTDTGQPILVHNNGDPKNPLDGCGTGTGVDYDPAEEVERIAREQASRGRTDLLSTLSPEVRDAAGREPWLGNAFTGHAVHNQTARELRNQHPGDFTYNPSNGPDYYHVPTGRHIELTTPGSVAEHERRAASDPRYGSDKCTIVTYDLPARGT